MFSVWLAPQLSTQKAHFRTVPYEKYLPNQGAKRLDMKYTIFMLHLRDVCIPTFF